MMRLTFLYKKMLLIRLKKKQNICINVFYYKDLLFVTDGDKWHYAYIKDFDRFIFHKTKNKNKKWFCRSCLQRFSN